MDTIKKIESKINEYGNIDFVPKGWITSSATMAQFKAAGVYGVKVLIGWKKTGIHNSPILKRYIYGKHETKLNAYLEAKKKANAGKKRKPSISAIKKYAKWMSENKEKQKDIVNEYYNNKNTKGTAWKLLSRAYQEGDIESAWAAYHMMGGARKRHEDTSYDALLQSGVNKEDARDIIRNEVSFA